MTIEEPLVHFCEFFFIEKKPSCGHSNDTVFMITLWLILYTLNLDFPLCFSTSLKTKLLKTLIVLHGNSKNILTSNF